MAIRIERNEAGNCINFYGSSNPTYWNACLSGEVDTTDANAVNVVNDVITAQTGVKQYEFFRIPYTEFTDKDGNGFADSQSAADYITANANVIGVSGDGIDLIGQSVCFSLDATSTSIMLDNGYSFGVNTIKAIADADGTIHIVSNNADASITYFYNLEVGNACKEDGTTIGGGLNDIEHYLNELFTVGAFEAVVISDPFSTMVADVDGEDITYSLEGNNSIDPIGDDVFGASASGSLNGFKSVETINQAGEYFTFDIRNEAQIGFGLIHTQASFDAGHYSGSATYANPTTFGTSNSAHYGFQFSHWFHPTPNGSWTNYGANTSYVMGYQAWSQGNWDQKQDWLDGNPVKIKVGIDENGYIGIYSLQNDSTWILHARTSYPVPEGAEFHLGIKCGDTKGRVYGTPKVHLLEELAPTMNFRYIESPDGYFQYPLFSTQEEANYYIESKGGTPLGDTRVFPDDPTNTVWYSGYPYYNSDAPEAPTTELFEGNIATYTEITSLTNSDMTPPAFPDTTITVDELSVVSFQVSPQDVDYVTTIGGIPNFQLIDGYLVQGTAPEVTDNNVINPSDTTTVTVYRTRNGFTSQGTLTINITNLTAPIVTPITGFTHDATSTALAGENTLASGSLVNMDEDLNGNRRLVILKQYVEDNILPALNQAGDKYIMGVLNSGADVSSIDEADYDFAFVWEYQSTTSHKYKVIKDGVQLHSVGIGSRTNAFYDYAIEVNDSIWMIGCNANAINTETSPAYGGSFSNATEVTGFDGSSPFTISIAYSGSTTADFGTTGVSEIVIPAADNWIQVTESGNVLSFDGSTTFPTLQAGYTYRLLMGEHTWADQVTDTHIQLGEIIKFTADGSTEYDMGGTWTQVGTEGTGNAYIEFTVPTDVPPLHWYGSAAHNPINLDGSNAIAISGSTYVVDITGITLEGLASNQTGTNIADNGDYGWMSIDESLSAGERFVMNNAFFEDLLAEMGDQYEIRIGLKGTNWSNSATSTLTNSVISGDIFRGDIQLRISRGTSNNIYLQLFRVGETGNQMLINTVSLHNDTCGFIEVDNTGDTIRMAFGRNGDIGVTVGSESTTTYEDWSSYKMEAYNPNFNITSIDVMFLVTDIFNGNNDNYDGANVDWTKLSEIPIPTPAVTNQTSWTKALDFSGSSERAVQVNQNTTYNALRMNGLSATVGGNANANYTTSLGTGRPWATAIVFSADLNSSNQHIWNSGEGANSTDDNIYLRLSSDGRLYFGWGRTGALNELYLGTLNPNIDWYGCYIASTGERLSGANATPTNLAKCFDIRLIHSGNNFTMSTYNWSNDGVGTGWNSSFSTTGGRMDRSILGDFTVGGRNANRNFHGKVASMVITTLKLNVPMPTDAEIHLMITDPKKWEDDYLVGNTIRQSHYTTNATYSPSNIYAGYGAIQIWLMGDGTSDSYSNMIRNEVFPSDQNYTKLNMLSMVSNDIQTVTINGLTQ